MNIREQEEQEMKEQIKSIWFWILLVCLILIGGYFFNKYYQEPIKEPQKAQEEDSGWFIEADSCQAFHITGVSIGTHYSCGVCGLINKEYKAIVNLGDGETVTITYPYWYQGCAVPVGGDKGYYNSSGRDIIIGTNGHLVFYADEPEQKYTFKEAEEIGIITYFGD